MELNEKLYDLSERIKQLHDKIGTEESTKQSFILPFFSALGYDVFNPLEFVPEYTADVGIKKNEKVDYAILENNNPLIIVEAKICSEKLDKHDSQLFRYYGTTKARFAILTNGIVYKFYTDLDKPNVMDSQPFYTLDMLSLSEQSISEIEKFKKSNFDINSILSSASDLKYLNLSKSIFKNLLDDPTEDFIKLILNMGLYDGLKNKKVIERFRPIIKKSMNQYINEKLSIKFKETLTNSDNEDDIEQDINKDDTEIKEDKIITTLEELNAFAIIKSMLRKETKASRLKYKDTESYFGILLDGNIRKWICRINLNTSKHHIFIPDENKKQVRYDINSIDDIYNYENELLIALKRFL
jgi:hypothetical protein